MHGLMAGPQVPARTSVSDLAPVLSVEAHRLEADLEATLIEQILHAPERKKVFHVPQRQGKRTYIMTDSRMILGLVRK